MHALYADADNLRYWSTPPSPDLHHTAKMMRWHLRYRPANYALWAVEERKSRRVIGMINYHHRNLQFRRVDVGVKVGPPAAAGWFREIGIALCSTA